MHHVQDCHTIRTRSSFLYYPHVAFQSNNCRPLVLKLLGLPIAMGERRNESGRNESEVQNFEIYVGIF